MTTPLEIAREAIRLADACERAFYEQGDGSKEWLDALTALEKHSNVTNHETIARALLASEERVADLELMMRAAVASERERCAKIAEEWDISENGAEIAAAIRASAEREKDA